jgi:hypothetical protein
MSYYVEIENLLIKFMWKYKEIGTSKEILKKKN